MNKFLKNLNRKRKSVTGYWSLVPGYSANAKRSQRGASVLEILLAIAIVAAVTPFIYNRIAETSREIMDVSNARSIAVFREKMSGYIRKNQSEWPKFSEIELDAEELLGIANPPRNFDPQIAFLEKYTSNGFATVESYIVFRPSGIDISRVYRIARDLGTNAAVADDNGMAYSVIGGWSVESKLLYEGDLVYRVTTSLGNDNSALYLHRMGMDDIGLNTMERDLFMSKHNILDTDSISGSILDSKSVRAWFAEAETLSTEDLRFMAGANLDVSDAKFNSIRVSGSIVGFRNMQAAKVTGASMNANWSNNGNMTADRASVTGAVHVGRDLIMRSSYAKNITGFAGASAYSLATPFVLTDRLQFASGYGLTISSEMTFGQNGTPLRLGSWVFPSGTSPKFKTLVLQRAGGDVAAAGDIPTGFEKILTAGWK